MAIRWDWLQPLISVPYVPSLGPVHPGAVTARLLADVTGIAGTGRFLPYDKDLRWGGRKDESVLADAIVQEPGLVLVPVLSTRRASCVKVCVYSREPREALGRAAELGRRLCAGHDAGKGRLMWFLPPGSAPDPVAARVRIQMRAFGPGCPADGVDDGQPGCSRRNSVDGVGDDLGGDDLGVVGEACHVPAGEGLAGESARSGGGGGLGVELGAGVAAVSGDGVEAAGRLRARGEESGGGLLSCGATGSRLRDSGVGVSSHSCPQWCVLAAVGASRRRPISGRCAAGNGGMWA